MEGSAHHVVVVARQHGQARARLPVPDANSLVVRSAHNPRVLIVKLNGADVVEVPEKSEKTAPKLVVPDLDLVVVAA